MTDNARKTGPAVEAHVQLLLWLVPAVEPDDLDRRRDGHAAGTRDGLGALRAAAHHALSRGARATG